jgi:ribosomal-protein-alanine N-acetyltransferase
MPGAPSPSAAFVQRCVDTLASRGFVEVVTSALSPAEQRAFTAGGFKVREHLLLLAHDMRNIPEMPPTPSGITVERARRVDRPEILAVDESAFSPFWRLDGTGLQEALDATPTSRLRLARDNRGNVIAYAVFGRAGRQGYVQRLAVHPDVQRIGLGRLLTIEGLRWMKRRAVTNALVNTQTDNNRALALYEDLGFRQQPAGLDVLSRRLDG